MKKHGFCRECNYEFIYKVNNMSDLDCICPKCGKKCSDKKYKAPTKLEKKVDILAHTILKFYYNFYLIFSILSISSYLLGFNKLLIVFTILMVSLYLIELLIGYTRNIFGILGFTISIFIGLFINNICLCITIMFLISSIIRLFYRFIIRFLFRKYG